MAHAMQSIPSSSSTAMFGFSCSSPIVGGQSPVRVQVRTELHWPRRRHYEQDGRAKSKRANSKLLERRVRVEDSIRAAAWRSEPFATWGRVAVVPWTRCRRFPVM